MAARVVTRPLSLNVPSDATRSSYCCIRPHHLNAGLTGRLAGHAAMRDHSRGSHTDRRSAGVAHSTTHKMSSNHFFPFLWSTQDERSPLLHQAPATQSRYLQCSDLWSMYCPVEKSNGTTQRGNAGRPCASQKVDLYEEPLRTCWHACMPRHNSSAVV